MRRATGIVATVCLPAVAFVGCQSSQELNDKLKKEGARRLANQHGLVIKTRNPYVKVLQTAVVTDPNGTAAAVVLRNNAKVPLGTTPIAINVVGIGGKSVFRNDAPGLQPALVSVAAIPPGAELTWVNDQVVPAGKALAVRAEVGAGAGAPPLLPRIDVQLPHLETDPTSGLEAVGKVFNRSSITQLKLFIYVSAWRGGRLVSAGRGAIAKLPPGRHANYHIFLIGTPQGAQFAVYAPPTVLR